VKAVRIRVTGAVQGVGFRPWVYRQARGLGLNGFVLNDLGGVVIHLEGPEERIEDFLSTLNESSPPASRITGINFSEVTPEGLTGFKIATSSKGEASQSLEVSADLATCSNCKAEILSSSDRRFGYAFTNCTDCGPRYSIIKALPYDRPKTVMDEFKMCTSCLHEYENPMDRRFHAQPNACAVCGPDVVLLDRYGRVVMCSDPVKETVTLIKNGRIVAVKGLGGFHLMCDAMNVDAVMELRKRKLRPHKALALMCRDLHEAGIIARISEPEGRALESPAAPILLLTWNEGVTGKVKDAIAPLNPGVGIMLAYTPLHHLMFAEGAPGALIATSANRGDEPVIAEEAELFRKLKRIFDAALVHNRKIENRIDDSVGYLSPKKSQGKIIRVPEVPNGKSTKSSDKHGWGRDIRLLRRARGFAPAPIETKFEFPPLLAVGAEMKGSFAVAEGRRMWLSPHIGELTNRETIRFFEETLETYLQWFRIKPQAVVCDLHPDYLSSRWAEKYSKEKGVPLIKVQHHHAHVASVMLEYGIKETVIGLSLDGTGYGQDGSIWGCELLAVTDEGAGFDRLGHLRGLPLVGGEAAIRKPGLLAQGVIAEYFGEEIAFKLFGRDGKLVFRRLEKNLGVLRDVSSAGRLFDAVAGLLGLCDEITFEAQAPIALEALASIAADEKKGYPFDIGADFTLDPEPALANIITDLERGVEKETISRRFHIGLADALLEWVGLASVKLGISDVCFSGGVFANQLLSKLLSQKVTDKELKILYPNQIPVSDGGLAAGQILVASSLI